MKIKKESKCLSVRIDKTLYEEFEEFIKTHDMSKAKITERAIRQYMDKINEVYRVLKKDKKVYLTK